MTEHKHEYMKKYRAEHKDSIKENQKKSKDSTLWNRSKNSRKMQFVIIDIGGIRIELKQTTIKIKEKTDKWALANHSSHSMK